MIRFSVVIVTYNSGEYITSVLESIKNQNYKPYEVIVTDDGSKDNTVQKCKKWLSQNPDCFQSFKIVDYCVNTGIVSNLIRGINSVSNECNWIKVLGGDDLLIPTCLYDYKCYIETYPNTMVLCSPVISFTKEDDITNIDLNEFDPVEIHKRLADCSAIKQKEYFDYFGMFTMTPTLAYRKDVLNSVHYDERIKMIEDTPFFSNVLRNGIKIDYFSRPTVFYRIGNSISHQSTRFVNPIFVESNIAMKKYYPLKKHHSLLGVSIAFKDWLSLRFFNFFYYTKHNHLSRFDYSIVKMIRRLFARWDLLNQRIYFAFYFSKS